MPAFCPGTTPFIVDVWSTRVGLPQSSVIALTQTRDGYLWLGTLNGLVRFDGTRFTVFDESNTPGLGSSRVVSLFEDRQGNLWVGTENAGVALITGGEIKSLDVGRGSREGRLMSVAEDVQGAVWLYTADGHLCRHWQGTVDVWKFGAQHPSRCRCVIAEKSGLLWVGMDWGLYGLRASAPPQPRELPPLDQVLPLAKLDYLLASPGGGYWRIAEGRIQKWTTNHLVRDLGAYPWKSTAQVSVACEDREGNLVVGTLNENDGVYWFGPDGRAAHISRAEGLSHDGILSLATDREGNLWVGTDGGGLNRVKRRVFEVVAASRGGVVQSVCADPHGGLWMVYNGNQATYWQQDHIQDFGAEQGWMNLWTVFVDRTERVWVGTRRGGVWRGGLFQLRSNRFESVSGAQAMDQDILAIHQDRQGVLWVGTQGGLARWDERTWQTFTMRDGLSGNVVRAIADDPEGNLWVGTTGGGLSRLRDGRFTTFRKGNGLPSDNVSALCVDSEGVLWVGTGGGLARYGGGQWTCYTAREGLAANSVNYLVEDHQGYLWLGANVGLMRVPKQALNDFAAGRTNLIHCRVYNESDGLPTSECTSGSQPAAWRTPDGRLWLPTTRGLVSVNPAELKINTHPPPVIIEAVTMEGLEQHTHRLRPGPLESVTIPAGKERLEIRYTSLNFTAPGQARFRYRLAGHERTWTEAGDSRIARYSKLPPGRYHFEVTAANEDGVWNETGCSLAVTVLPPFWRTWWFVSGCGAVLLGVIVGAVYYGSTQRLRRQLERLKQQEALERERARIARDLHDQLGANLTQVALLGELVETDKNSPADVAGHAQQISQTARETTRALDEIVWATNPANDTLDALATYVCKYAQEYLGLAGLKYRLDVPAQIPSQPLPPEVRHNVFLAFKEALTNVVKHAAASEAWVRLRLEPKTVTLEVADNGRGLSAEASNVGDGRNGLNNMRQRMNESGGQFYVGPGPGGGTLVRLTIPLTRAGTGLQSFQ